MSVYEKLTIVQRKLNAPKNKYNKFGGYYYRNCESIMEGVKPLLSEVKATLVITDDIVQVAERIYVKATAKFIDTENGEIIEASAFAREPLASKGMADSQITGAASSYARKYVLSGLFCIDDNDDEDTQEVSDAERKQLTETKMKADKEAADKQKAQKAEAIHNEQEAQKTDETKNKEMAESVNPNLVPHGEMIDAGQIAMMQSEMKRTGVTLQQILSIAQVESIDKMNQPTAISILNKLGNTKPIQG